MLFQRQFLSGKHSSVTGNKTHSRQEKIEKKDRKANPSTDMMDLVQKNKSKNMHRQYT